MDAHGEGVDVGGVGDMGRDQMGEGAEAGNRLGELEWLNAGGNPKLTKSGAAHVEIASGSTRVASM
jgi:hypothetical protein